MKIGASSLHSSTRFCDTAYFHARWCANGASGLIPSTLAEDGDPTDVLVLMDEPAFPGCLLKCRVVGIIEDEQGKKKQRNDRIVAVEQENHSYAYVKHVDDWGKKFVHELEEFFVNYHRMLGKTYSIIGVKGPGEARRRIKDGMRANAHK